MAASPSALPRSVVAARLRAAGCVFAEDEARLLISAARTPADLEGMVDRRAAGLPLEHVLGWAAFCGLRIAVDSGVFVPRRRTEFLVSQAAALGRPGAVVVDLCCGSGAVGAALAAALGRVDILVANAPYVPTDAIGLMAPEARIHEPRVALDGGRDGLDLVRRISAAAPQWMAPRGHLLIETSQGQAPQAVDALTRDRLIPRVARSDELNVT